MLALADKVGAATAGNLNNWPTPDQTSFQPDEMLDSFVWDDLGQDLWGSDWLQNIFGGVPDIS
jgi:hypothetical protein